MSVSARLAIALLLDCFQDAHFGGCGHDTFQREAGRCEQVSIFIGGALFAAGDEQHHEVEKLAAEGLIAFRNDTFDHQKLAGRGHRLMAVAENREGLVFFPVVDDMPQQVGIGAGWHAFKEIAADELAAIEQAGTFQGRSRTIDHVRQVEEDAFHLRVLFENRGELRSIAAANIRYDADVG